MSPEVSISREKLPRASYTIEEVKAATGINRNKLFALIAEGKLKTFTHGRRRFVSASALATCISALEKETAAAEKIARGKRKE